MIRSSRPVSPTQDPVSKANRGQVDCSTAKSTESVSENMAPASSTHLGPPPSVTGVLGDVLFWPPRAPGMWCTDGYAGKKNPYT